MKEHKKLYKSGKLWLTATVLAVAAGATMATTSAHADTTSQPAGQQASDKDSQIAALQSDAKQQQATINDAQSQLATQQGKLTATQKQLDAAQADYQKALTEQDQATQNDPDVQSATTAVNKAQQKVSTAQDGAKQAAAALSDAQTRQQQANDELSQAKSGSSQQTGFQLPDGYTRENYHKLQDALADGNMDVRDAWDNMAGQNYMKFKYVHSAQDKQEAVDPAHLTNQQRIEISQFVIDLLNPLREKIGAQPFVVSQGSVDLAQAVADQYNADKVYSGHDYPGLNKVEVANARAFREAVEGLDTSINNMDDLKAAIFSAIDDMIFHDTPDWGHARTLLGLLNDTDLNNESDPATQSYLGMSVSGDATNGMMIHFIPTYDDVDELEGTPAHPFDKTVIKEAKQDNTAAIKAAQDKLDQANTDVTNAQQSKKGADDQLTQAQAELAAAEQSLVAVKASASAKTAQRVSDAKGRVTDLQGQVTGLKGAIEKTNQTLAAAQAKLAQDNQQLAELQKPQAQPDNEKYTNLDPSLVVKVNVTAGDTTIPVPTLAAGAYIKNTDNGTASAAMFMVLAQTNGVYPEGTKVEWADPAKVQKDAQTAGTYDEEVILDFPDGTKSKAFNVPGVLVVAAKPNSGNDSHQTTPTNATHTLTVHYIETIGYQPMGAPITKVVGTQVLNGQAGTDFSESQLNLPAGYKLAMPGLTLTISDQDDMIEVPVLAVNSSTDDHSGTNQSTGSDHNASAQLPAGAKIVKGQVLDANGNVLAGWTVVNGQAVRNGSAVAVNAQGQIAKRLPQTGNNDSLALAGLGAASLLGMFGLAGVNKKRG